MSEEYNKYLENHIGGVIKGFEWFAENLPDFVSASGGYKVLKSLMMAHDVSKYDDIEYEAYDAYFYGSRTDEVEYAFAYAWNHHQKNNKHHWQYWTLINDDDGEPYAVEMPLCFVIEMICDWWSFSWNKNNLMEIFDFYNSHKNTMILHENTRAIVEEILNKIKLILQSQDIANDEILQTSEI